MTIEKSERSGVPVYALVILFYFRRNNYLVIIVLTLINPDGITKTSKAIKPNQPGERP